MKLTINYRQTACRLLAALFFFLLLAPMAAGQEVSPTPTYWKEQISKVDRLANKDGGNGTKGNPILIASAEELAYFAQQVNSKLPITYGNGNDKIEPGGNRSDIGGFFDYYFALSADINLEKHYWTPIGTNDNPFKGYFDGKGHCVSGLKVNVKEMKNSAPVSIYAGLFGNAHNGTIQNLGVCLAKEGVWATNANTMGGNLHAGGIAGCALHVHNCYVVGEGSIEINGGGNGYAGGIVGYITSYGSLTNCYATVDIRIETNGERHAGGIAGQCDSNSTISYTYATGDVEIGTGGNLYYAGGICGYLNSRGKIENSLALNGRITGGDSNSNRIVGSTGKETTLRTNYASPEIVVNGKTVSGGGDADANGDPNVNLDNFGTVIDWGDGWDTSEPTQLPKLRMRTGDGPEYKDWPTGEDFTPQSPPDATLNLIAGKIANAGDGDGLSWKNAIQIANRAELAYLAKQVNAKGNLTVAEGVDGGSIENKTGDDSGFKGIYFALANDIDLSDYWTPIGTFSTPFNGNFDGKGYCVSGLKVDGAVEYAGLFGCAEDGTLRNIGVHLAKEGVYGIKAAGGIAGMAANINNCYVVGDGMIKAGPKELITVGGIAGTIFGSLSNCYATIDVEGEGGTQNHVGGIVGYGESTSSVSYTYSTGNVFANGGYTNYAGGICGYSNGELYSNLAANGKIKGDDSKSHRIVGCKANNEKFDSNYASATIQVNSAPVTGGDADSWDGTPSYLSTFVDDLKDAGWSREKGWEDFSSGTNLPQLMMLKQDGNGYETWNPKTQYLQPSLTVSDNLPPCPKLYIVSPTGGNLTVTDKDGNELPNGSDILPGTLLTLANTEDANYHFSEYLSGSNEGSLSSYSGNSIMMPDADLYLSATFTYQKPEPEEPPYIPPVPPYVPPVPIYYSVYLPQVEGASTDPGPGEYEVESWSTFRFYLTIDSAYSESQPVVTTDRGETLVPRSSDGAYLVKYVRTDVEVFIDGLIQNPPPVANEAIGTDALVPQIWAEGTMLCIRMAEALPSFPVRIFTVDGRLYDSFASTPGLNRRQLPTGVYIVRIGDTACKVIVK